MLNLYNKCIHMWNTPLMFCCKNLIFFPIHTSRSCIIHRSQADTAAEADDLRVISKEAVGHSWDILSAIMGHKHHHNHPNRNLQTKSEFYHINFVSSLMHR